MEGLKILNWVGERVLKAKNCKQKYKVEFLEGWVIQTKTPCMRGGDYTEIMGKKMEN